MTLFSGYPAYPRYRALKLSDPLLRGEDVYALQTGLMAAGYDVGAFDGALGKVTAGQIRNFQQDRFLVADGIAGPRTQQVLVDAIADKQAGAHGVPHLLMRGQLAHESGKFVGNYSPQRADGSYDAGVAQRNTAHTPAAEGFDVPDSIEALAGNTRRFYDEFEGVPGRRRWELAAGAWNAPAFARWIAKQEGAQGVRARDTAKPGTAARALLEAYMASVTALLP